MSISVVLLAVFGNYPLQAASFKESVVGSGFYESTSRVAWAGALAWIVFACTNELGGPVNWFLSLRMWQPLSRLSYSIYLVHLPVQVVLSAQVRSATFFSDTQTVSVWIILIFFSIHFSFCCSYRLYRSGDTLVLHFALRRYGRLHLSIPRWL